MERDAISRDEVLEWMDKQWPQKEIIRRADYVIVNDGHQQLLPQLKPLLKIDN
jgi:dephospho-CoA kinase